MKLESHSILGSDQAKPQETGTGSERVRAPRLVLTGAERKAALDTLKQALKTRPKV